MTLGNTVPSQFHSEGFRLFDGQNVTKKARFILSGITPGNTRALTILDQSGVISLEGHSHVESDISDLDHYDSADFAVDFASKSTDDLAEDINLYFTNERAQDAVGGILDDGTVGEIVFTYDDVGNRISGVVQDGEIDHDSLANTHNLTTSIDHDQLTNFAANEHFLQTVITNVSTVLSTGLLKVTTGTGVLSVVIDSSSNWNDAHTHSELLSGNPHNVTPTELSLVIGTNVQARSAVLDDLSTTGATASELDELTDGSETTLHSHIDLGATVFTGLTDTPVSYDSADAGKVVRVKDDLSGLEFVEGAGGITTFIGLTDTPANYNGEAGNCVIVNAGENGLEFGVAPGGSFSSYCRAYISSDQGTGVNVWTKLEFDTESYDNNAEFDNVTNYRWTCKNAGYYHFDAYCEVASIENSHVVILAVKLNDTTWIVSNKELAGVTQIPALIIASDYQFAVDDFLEVWIYSQKNTTTDDTYGEPYFSIHRFA